MVGLPRESLYRPTRPLTYELANHSKAYFEMRQYAGGFSFLNALLISGTSISTPNRSYSAFLAPTSQLALASSLIVYPGITTKAKSADTVKGADAALRYLRNVQNIVNPINETLRGAFAFPDERSRKRAAGYRTLGLSPSPEVDESKRLKGLAATSQSLWMRATDFWHIVGWAFNCSVVHKKRWERWKLWLEVMLDFLEAEWAERVKLILEEGGDAHKILTKSLLWHYVSSRDAAIRSNRRVMVGAILSMGSLHSRKLFPEIWEEETAEPEMEEEEGNALAKIDIENGDFGDYEKVDEDVAMHGQSKVALRCSTGSPESSPPKSDDEFLICSSEEAIGRLGGMDAIILRQRLLALLVQVAQYIPDNFTTLGDLFDQFTEAYLQLPTNIFSVLLSTSQIPLQVQMGLNSNLLFPLLSGALPDYTVMEPTQEHLEEYFLPSRATTHRYAANAKISLIFEQMVMYFMSAKRLNATDDLRSAVESGIEAREKAYGNASRKKGNTQEEEQAKIILDQSTERLLGLLEIVELSAGKEL
ncbi:uncharacterized protein BDR25DRAFT_231030 [Lindgomyces ingoldianus]|uniref:Uncharacterized protein n=1 Tax=Lindgomyces ingoldianus TaxID=673940 RepID=A0ACB6QPW6_9PLEO|nr:uncharacterized protein BDR25DRAFT_231030 [Lindgomyces ingoldianus]KAF2468565.1 hypothetical protein BDR25DRAFT_231030 [Lindgomyces ingoldianus]